MGLENKAFDGWENVHFGVGTACSLRRTMSYIPGLANDNELYTRFRYLRELQPGHLCNDLIDVARIADSCDSLTGSSYPSTVAYGPGL